MNIVSGSGNSFVLIDVEQSCEMYGTDGLLVVNGNRMRIFNADGSKADMCGNGLRCVMAHLVDEGEVEVETDAGVYRGIVMGDEVEVLMESVRWIRDGVVWSGVEHYIVEGLDGAKAISGRNVNYVEGNLVRTFERGVGETRSCGTGATAVAFAYGLSEVQFVSGEKLQFRHTSDGIWMKGRVERKCFQKTFD